MCALRIGTWQEEDGPRFVHRGDPAHRYNEARSPNKRSVGPVRELKGHKDDNHLPLTDRGLYHCAVERVALAHHERLCGHELGMWY